MIKVGTKILLERKKRGSDWSNTPPSERLTVRTVQSIRQEGNRSYTVTFKEDKKNYYIRLPLDMTKDVGFAQSRKANYEVVDLADSEENFEPFNLKMLRDQRNYDARQQEARKRKREYLERRLGYETK